MKVLLTGATGFIGSHIARAFVAARHEVHALVRSRRNLWRIADIQSSLRLIEGDLFHLPVLPNSLDVCLHLAWYVEPGQYLESPLNRDYQRASLALAQHRFPRLVVAGTCFEYDSVTTGPLSEDSPTSPRSLYARCKLELLQQLQQHGIAVAWTRFFYQYGPAEDSRRLMPAVINSLLRGQPIDLSPGEQVRDYLHVRDVAAAVVAVAESELTGPVNIGSGLPVTIREIAESIGREIGRPDLLRLGSKPYAPGDPMFVLANNTKLKETGWKPQITLADGLRQTIEWWRRHTPPGSTS